MENSGVLKSKKKKKRIITILIILFFLCFGQPYYKPAYSGRVVDLETGEPLSEAVISVGYWVGYYGLIEQNSKEIKSQEYYTDKNGYFYIPKYFALISLFNWDSGVTFSVEKKHYTSLIGKDLQECLSSGCDEHKFGVNESISISSNLIKLSKYKKQHTRL